MERSKREKLVALFEVKPTISNKEAAELVGVHRNTVSKVRKQFQQSTSTLICKRQEGSGRKVNKKNVERVVRSIKNNPGTSDRDRARRLGIPRTTVQRYRSNAGYRAYTAKKRPNRDEKKSKVSKTRARRLYTNILTKFKGCLLIDDETYVKADFRQIPGQKFYYSKIRGDVPKKYKAILIDKYAKKYMIWQGLCTCGLKTAAYVTNANMTSNLYQKECLEKIVLPFIDEHKGPLKFWPDLASCHYSNSTLNFYKENKMDVIPKNHNPPNTPELRPIERYWAIIKQKLFKYGGSIRTPQELFQKWNKFAATMTKASVQDLMRSVTKKTRKFIRS